MGIWGGLRSGGDGGRELGRGEVEWGCGDVGQFFFLGQRYYEERLGRALRSGRVLRWINILVCGLGLETGWDGMGWGAAPLFTITSGAKVYGILGFGYF